MVDGSAQPCPVLLIAQQLGDGGSERQLAELAKGLDRSRFLPHAGVFRRGGSRANELEAAGIPVTHFPVTSLADPRGALRLAQYVRAHGIRLTHTFDAPANIYAAPAARAAGCPVVVSSQRAHRDLAPRWLRPWLRAVDLMSDGVVVNCDFLRRHLMEDERVPERRIHVCYNGIDPARFDAPVEGRPEALLVASLVIGVVCVLRPEKGLETLVDAFARVNERQAGMKLAIVGSGERRADLEARARALGVFDACVFEPSTPDVARWLRAIDIFVLPSRSEAFSNSLMEAMACGCAAAASRVGGNPELVREGETGLLFEAGDSSSLAAALTTLIERPDLRAELARNGRERIRARFGIAAAARRMQEIYSLLLSRRGE